MAANQIKVEVVADDRQAVAVVKNFEKKQKKSDQELSSSGQRSADAIAGSFETSGRRVQTAAEKAAKQWRTTSSQIISNGREVDASLGSLVRNTNRLGAALVQAAKQGRNTEFLEKRFKQVTEETKKAILRSQELEKSIENLGKKSALISNIGGAFLTLSASVASVLFAINKVSGAGISLEKSLTRVAQVGNLNLNEVGGAFDQIRQKAQELGATTAFTATQVADTFANLIAGGLNAQESLKAINGVLNLAGATGENIEFVGEVIISTMNQFGLAADQADRIADVFIGAFTTSAANVGRLAEGLKEVGPIANSLGISLEDTAAALSLLNDNAITGARAGTQLRGIISTLTSITPETARIFQVLGLSLESFTNSATGQFIGLDASIQKISEGLRGLNQVETQAIVGKLFGRENVAAAQIFVNSVDGLRSGLSRYVTQQRLAITAEESYQIALNNTAGRLELAKSAVDGVFQSLFEKLSPAVNSAISLFTSLADNINQFLSSSDPFVVFLRSILGTITKATTVFLAFKTTLAAVSIASQAYSLVLVKVAAAKAALTVKTLLLSNSFLVLVKRFQAASLLAKAGLLGAITALVGVIAALITHIDSVSNAFQRFQPILDGIVATLKAVALGFASVFSVLGDALTGNFQGAIDRAKQIFIDGLNEIQGELQQKQESFSLGQLIDQSSTQDVINNFNRVAESAGEASIVINDTTFSINQASIQLGNALFESFKKNREELEARIKLLQSVGGQEEALAEKRRELLKINQQEEVFASRFKQFAVQRQQLIEAERDKLLDQRDALRENRKALQTLVKSGQESFKGELSNTNLQIQQLTDSARKLDAELDGIDELFKKISEKDLSKVTTTLTDKAKTAGVALSSIGKQDSDSSNSDSANLITAIQAEVDAIRQRTQANRDAVTQGREILQTTEQQIQLNGLAAEASKTNSNLEKQTLLDKKQALSELFIAQRQLAEDEKRDKSLERAQNIHLEIEAIQRRSQAIRDSITEGRSVIEANRQREEAIKSVSESLKASTEEERTALLNLVAARIQEKQALEDLSLENRIQKLQQEFEALTKSKSELEQINAARERDNLLKDVSNKSSENAIRLLKAFDQVQEKRIQQSSEESQAAQQIHALQLQLISASERQRKLMNQEIQLIRERSKARGDEGKEQIRQLKELQAAHIQAFDQGQLTSYNQQIKEVKRSFEETARDQKGLFSNQQIKDFQQEAAKAQQEIRQLFGEIQQLQIGDVDREKQITDQIRQKIEALKEESRVREENARKEQQQERQRQANIQSFTGGAFGSSAGTLAGAISSGNFESAGVQQAGFAAAGQVVGQEIEKQNPGAGGVVNSTAQGALIGASFGGPIGAIIGGGVGLVKGLADFEKQQEEIDKQRRKFISDTLKEIGRSLRELADQIRDSLRTEEGQLANFDRIISPQGALGRLNDLLGVANVQLVETENGLRSNVSLMLDNVKVSKRFAKDVKSASEELTKAIIGDYNLRLKLLKQLQKTQENILDISKSIELSVQFTSEEAQFEFLNFKIAQIQTKIAESAGEFSEILDLNNQLAALLKERHNFELDQINRQFEEQANVFANFFNWAESFNQSIDDAIFKAQITGRTEEETISLLQKKATELEREFGTLNLETDTGRDRGRDILEQQLGIQQKLFETGAISTEVFTKNAENLRTGLRNLIAEQKKAADALEEARQARLEELQDKTNLLLSDIKANIDAVKTSLGVDGNIETAIKQLKENTQQSLTEVEEATKATERRTDKKRDSPLDPFNFLFEQLGKVDLAKEFGRLFQGLGQILDGIGVAFARPFEQLGQGIEKIGRGFVDGTGKLIGGIGKSLGGFFEGLKQIDLPLLDIVKQTFEGLGELDPAGMVRDIFGGIGNIFSKLAESFNNILPGGVDNFIKDLFTFPKGGTIANITNQIRNFFQDILSVDVSALGQNFLGTITGFFQNIGKNVLGGLDGLVKNMFSFDASVFEKLLTPNLSQFYSDSLNIDFGKMTRELQDKLSGVFGGSLNIDFNKVKNDLVGKLDDFVKKLIPDVGREIKSALERIEDFFRKTIPQPGGSFKDLLDRVGDVFSQIFSGGIPSFFQQVGDALRNFFSGGFSFVGEVQRKVGELLGGNFDFIGILKKKIEGFFSGCVENKILGQKIKLCLEDGGVLGVAYSPVSTKSLATSGKHFAKGGVLGTRKYQDGGQVQETQGNIELFLADLLIKRLKDSGGCPECEGLLTSIGFGNEFANGGVLNGPRHSGGGVKLFKKDGQFLGEAEGGEGIIPRDIMAMPGFMSFFASLLMSKGKNFEKAQKEGFFQEGGVLDRDLKQLNASGEDADKFLSQFGTSGISTSQSIRELKDLSDQFDKVGRSFRKSSDTEIEQARKKIKSLTESFDDAQLIGFQPLLDAFNDAGFAGEGIDLKINEEDLRKSVQDALNLRGALSDTVEFLEGIDTNFIEIQIRTVVDDIGNAIKEALAGANVTVGGTSGGQPGLPGTPGGGPAPGETPDSGLPSPFGGVDEDKGTDGKTKSPIDDPLGQQGLFNISAALVGRLAAEILTREFGEFIEKFAREVFKILIGTFVGLFLAALVFLAKSNLLQVILKKGFDEKVVSLIAQGLLTAVATVFLSGLLTFWQGFTSQEDIVEGAIVGGVTFGLVAASGVAFGTAMVVALAAVFVFNMLKGIAGAEIDMSQPLAGLTKLLLELLIAPILMLFTGSDFEFKEEDGKGKFQKVDQKKKGGKIEEFASGGFLQGPSHAQGGVPALVAGKRPVELEGGEFIIKRDSVNKIGVSNLDRANRTGKFQQGGQVFSGSTDIFGGKLTITIPAIGAGILDLVQGLMDQIKAPFEQLQNLSLPDLLSPVQEFFDKVTQPFGALQDLDPLILFEPVQTFFDQVRSIFEQMTFGLMEFNPQELIHSMLGSFSNIFDLSKFTLDGFNPLAAPQQLLNSLTGIFSAQNNLLGGFNHQNGPNSVLGALKNIFEQQKSFLGAFDPSNLPGQMLGALQNIFHRQRDFLNGFDPLGAPNQMFGVLGNKFNQIGSFLNGIDPGLFKNPITDALRQLGDKVKDALERVKPKFGSGGFLGIFAAGGLVQGPSHDDGGVKATVDGKMIELEGGEFIIRRDAVSKLGTQVLQAINETGQLPTNSLQTFARGGRIESDRRDHREERRPREENRDERRGGRSSNNNQSERGSQSSNNSDPNISGLSESIKTVITQLEGLFAEINFKLTEFNLSMRFEELFLAFTTFFDQTLERLGIVTVGGLGNGSETGGFGEDPMSTSFGPSEESLILFSQKLDEVFITLTQTLDETIFTIISYDSVAKPTELIANFDNFFSQATSTLSSFDSSAAPKAHVAAYEKFYSSSTQTINSKDSSKEPRGLIAAIDSLFGKMIHAIEQSDVGRFTDQLFRTLGGMFDRLSAGVRAVNTAQFVDPLTGSLRSLSDRVKNALDRVTPKFGGGGGKQFFGLFASGGLVQGPSHNEGGVKAAVGQARRLIELEGGEFIISKQAVSQLGVKTLEFLNETGQLPIPSVEAFQEGGLIGENIDSVAGAKTVNQVENHNTTFNNELTIQINQNGEFTTFHVDEENGGEEILQAIIPKLQDLGIGNTFGFEVEDEIRDIASGNDVFTSGRQ